MRSPSVRRPSAAVAALALVGLPFLGGCGADSVAPEKDTLIEVPAEAATLQEAVDKAGLGDQIVIADGQYTVDAPVVIPSGKPGLILRGADGTRPRLTFTLDPDSADAFVVLAPNCSIRSLEIDGAYRVGIFVQPGTFEGAGDVTDCILRDAGRHAIQASSSAANITIERNILADPAVFGVICANGASPVIRNNTIAGAGDCAIFVQDSSRPVCERNILAGSATYGIACFSVLPPSMDCNVLFQNGVSNYSVECVPGANDLETDPMFCDPVAFTLLPGSPCAPGNAGSCQGIGAVTTVCTP